MQGYNKTKGQPTLNPLLPCHDTHQHSPQFAVASPPATSPPAADSAAYSASRSGPWERLDICPTRQTGCGGVAGSTALTCRCRGMPDWPRRAPGSVGAADELHVQYG